MREIADVFVSGEAKPDSGAVHHSVHGLVESPCAKRDKGDEQNLQGFFGDAGDEQRVFVNGQQWMLSHGDMLHQPSGEVAQREYAQRTKNEGSPNNSWRLRAAVRSDDKPEQQQGWRYGTDNDCGRGEVEYEHVELAPVIRKNAVRLVIF
jgi:hypothetical protein